MGVKRAVDEDPLSVLLAPPPNETAEERETRLRLEAEARSISERIDEQLKAERAALKKNRPVKVLLLGQSESGACMRRLLTECGRNRLSPICRKVDHTQK